MSVSPICVLEQAAIWQDQSIKQTASGVRSEAAKAVMEKIGISQGKGNSHYLVDTYLLNYFLSLIHAEIPAIYLEPI